MSSIPAALRERERRVCWTYVHRSAGKPTKVPLDPKQPSRHASVTDPSTRSSYARACLVAEEFELGVGCVLGDGLVGFDLDDCVVDDGDGEFRIHPAAAEIVTAVDSYTHLSPSRTGIHVVGFGRLDSCRHSTTATPGGEPGRAPTGVGRSALRREAPSSWVLTVPGIPRVLGNPARAAKRRTRVVLCSADIQSQPNLGAPNVPRAGDPEERSWLPGRVAAIAA
jgi:hypothetical protein